MKSTLIPMTVRELTENVLSVDDNGKIIPYEDASNVDEFGVLAKNGELEVRPTYQRNFVWSLEKQRQFIKSVLKNWSINPLVFAKTENADGTFKYECVDGQQRTITLCKFRYNMFTVSWGGENYFDGLSMNQKKDFLKFPLLVFMNEYESTDEKIEHFTAINQPTTVLSKQELRNAAYDGPFVGALRAKFGTKKCIGATRDDLTKYVAFNIDLKEDELNPNSNKIYVNRQELVELAIKWSLVLEDDEVYDLVKNDIATRHAFKNDEFLDNKIRDYMRKHRFDEDCKIVLDNYTNICHWISKIFNNFSNTQMKNVKNWAYLYRTYKDCQFDSSVMRAECEILMKDADIHHKHSIPEYLMIIHSTNCSDADKEKWSHDLLSLRAFESDIKERVWVAQNHRCLDCGEELDIEEMEAHHIVPWAMGGRTEDKNCAMLCKRCHKKRHGFLI